MAKAHLTADWLYRFACKAKDYLILMRFHQPIGIFLLGWPVAWALWIAYEGTPPLRILGLFLAGTVIMRAAGCIINDIADRQFDHQVKRTQHRLLTQGKVQIKEALALFFSLLFIALLILLQLPSNCFYYALAAVFLTSLYPFCKRFMRCPQIVLSLAFSMSIPMSFATTHPISIRSVVLLWLINLSWVMAYDTEYAMSDRDDDLKIGIHSTAIFFGRWDRFMIAVFQSVTHLLWLLLLPPFHSALKSSIVISLMIWVMGGLQLVLQQKKLTKREANASLEAFLSNHWYGLIMWVFCFQYFSKSLN